MKISMKYFSVIGIILFIFVITKTDTKKIIEILLNINIYYIILSFFMLAISLYIRSLKWKVLVNIFSKEYGILEAFVTYTIGVAFGSVTPAKAGDFIKVVDLKKRTNIDTKQGISICLFDKIIDIQVLFGLGLISLILITFLFSTKININWLIAPLIFFLIGLIFAITKYSKGILIPLYNILGKSKIKEKIKILYESFRSVIETTRNNKKIFLYGLLTIASWFSIFLIPYVLLNAIGLNIPISYFLIFIPIVFCVEVLPISPLGIGSRDAALVLLFSLIGINSESMVSLSLLMLVFGTLPVLLIGFLFAWKNKFKIELNFRKYHKEIFSRANPKDEKTPIAEDTNN